MVVNKNKYVVHATVVKYDEGLQAETKANVNGVFKAINEELAAVQAIDKFTKDYDHPKISNIRVIVNVVNKI